MGGAPKRLGGVAPIVLGFAVPTQVHGEGEGPVAIRTHDGLGRRDHAAGLARFARTRFGRTQRDVEHASDGVGTLAGDASARPPSLAPLFTLLSCEFGGELHEGGSIRAYHDGAPKPRVVSQPALRWPAPRGRRAPTGGRPGPGACA